MCRGDDIWELGLAEKCTPLGSAQLGPCAYILFSHVPGRVYGQGKRARWGICCRCLFPGCYFLVKILFGHFPNHDSEWNCWCKTLLPTKSDAALPISHDAMHGEMKDAFRKKSYTVSEVCQSMRHFAAQQADSLGHIPFLRLAMLSQHAGLLYSPLVLSHCAESHWRTHRNGNWS